MFVTNWISTTKIQKISEITNFFRHYFLSRTEVIVWLKRAESPKALSPGRIYAILHFSNYRKKFKEQLKYQFPRIPYPQNEEE